jgi:hypothetical protein
MTRLVWVMDPETAAHVTTLFDRATSPRRGGPRFVTGNTAEVAARIIEDPRTTDQLASDVFVDLLRAGADADSSQLLGSGAPVVNVIVTQKDADAGASADGTPAAGIGYIEGQSVPVSIATIERLQCAGIVLQATLDTTQQPLDLGREQRLFNRKQRRMLALTNGGCMVPGCTCPPSWTEAHHLKYWARDNGATNIGNGILLCRFHHLLLHNNRWEITQDNNHDYWLIPPTDVDPKRTPRPMHSKNPALRRPA